VFAAKAQCEYTIDGTDSYGDGWNGAYITINVGTDDPVTFGISSAQGSSNSVTISADLGDDVTFTWSSGSWDSEVTITITDSYGVQLYSGGAPNDGVEFASDTCSGPETCPIPTSFASSNITNTSVDFAWTAGGSETLWDFEVVNVTAGESATGTPTTEDVDANSYTISGLTPGAVYKVYLRADCSGDNSDASNWISSTFNMLCVGEIVDSFPWTQDFSDGDGYVNNDGFLPSCWSYIDNNDDGVYFRGFSDTGTDGAWGVGMYTYVANGGAGSDDYLVLPQFSFSRDMTLSYQVRSYYSFLPNDYKVLLSTTGTDPADFTEELLPLTVVSSTTYATQNIDLSDYSGDVYIAIQIPPGGNRGFYLLFDEFQVIETPAPPLCAVNLSPADGETDVAVSTTNNGTVNFTWDANPLGDTPTEYTFNFGTAPGSFVYSTTTSLNEINLSPLYPNETYYWQVVPNNAAGDATSAEHR
jgi:hypothetical protein